MRVHQETLPDVDRYLANFGSYELADKTPDYERYLKYAGKLRQVDAGTRILEVGTGTGWFPLLCKVNGLQCKGLEISPQLVDFAFQMGKRHDIVPDIELGNVEDSDIGAAQYDLIVASNVFEHVEHWRSGLAKLYTALKPGGVMFFESTNKFTFGRSGEYSGVPFYGWLPNAARYRLRQAVHGKEIMKLGIDFTQFTHGMLRREFKKLGFRKIVDVVDLVDARPNEAVQARGDFFLPGIPAISIPAVDVRDASHHVRLPEVGQKRQRGSSGPMKLLWVKTDFLHPTNRGGQIRTLEMVRRLHRNHEVHYVAFDNPAQPEGLARSPEYCAKAYPVAHRIASKTSPAFARRLVAGLFSRLPVVITRYRSLAMLRQVEALVRQHKFDCVVCDFLFPTLNIPQLDACILFQHNVESMIWKRYVEHAAGLKKLYFRLQAKRMLNYEGEVCRSVRKVVAVSEADADTMRRLYGASRVYPVPTGVDLDYFARPDTNPKLADLAFVGSMDWMPNIDGIVWFVREILPLIRSRRPDCTFAIVGRRPSPKLTRLAESDPLIKVTGTVPDVRPWLFGSLVSVVPLRIGGGTRLKIYEAMAARAPVVSTTIGAEGLDIADGENIHLADSPQRFAECCLALLDSAAERERMAASAWNLVASKYSWDVVTRAMERLLFE